MTSRDRVARALRGEPTDRPALAYLFLGGARHVLERTGQRMLAAYGDPRSVAQTQITAAELFGHDTAMAPWGCLTVEAEAFGCRLEAPEDYYPHVVERPLAEERNLSRLARVEPSTSGRMPRVLESLTQIRERGGQGLYVIAMVVSPFLVAAELRGMSALLMDFLTHPSFVEDLFERVTEGIAAYVESILRTGACDAILFENAGACRELMGPHHLRRYVMPNHRKLLEAARGEAPDVQLIEHNCSRTPYFREILDLDVDAVSFAYGDVRAIREIHALDCHEVHTRINACVDRFCLRPDRERSIGWIGNVDHSRILLEADPEQVFREARACIESARLSPFVLSTGCEIPFKAPLENILALSRAARAGFAPPPA